MKKILSVSLFFIAGFLFQTVSAQTPQPNATPPFEDDGEVVKISTNLIQIDVVVTDKNGRQITDLRPEDFEIYENGKRQEITNFSYISGLNNEQNSRPQPVRNSTGGSSVPPPPAKLRPEQVRRTYALVVDDLGISFENIPAVKASLKKFINEDMQEGDLVAVVRTGGGMGALQSFTSDKRQLLAAVENIRWNPQGRGKVNAFMDYQRSFKDKDNDFNKEGEENPNLPFKPLDNNYKNEDLINSNYSTGSLGALSYVIRGMKELPGRKSVLFFSEGFQTFVIEDRRSTLIPEKKTYNRVLTALRNIAELANRSSVVIYTLDPRGLINPAALRQNRFRREESYVKDSQQTLRYLAEETGGLAFVDSNKLDKGLQKAVEDQSGYYLIAYEPDAETFDTETSKFNKFRVKVKNSDYEVRYRSGFYGISNEIIDEKEKTGEQRIYNALISPFGATDINVSLYTLFADDRETGPFIRSLLGIDPADLVFRKGEDGIYRANFDIVAMTFGDNGAPVDQNARNYTIQLTAENYRRILEKGFVYDLLIPLKKAGAYQFRIALRDTATDKIGSASQFIQVPDLKKNRLTISSIVLKGFTPEELKTKQNTTDNGFLDTSRREFKRGMTLRYDYVVYNAAGSPKRLKVQAKLFRGDELALESEPGDLRTTGQADPERIESVGALTLGSNLGPGEYILQIIVRDENAKEKHGTTAQVVDFVIVE
jgi:VWFA-related protein